MTFRAVIFDLGGVVLGSPLHAITHHEHARGLPVGLITRLVLEGGPEGAWQQLERGELDVASFCRAFDAEAEAAGHALDSAAMMGEIGEASQPRPVMLEAIARIRARPLVAAALTNNWAGEQDRTRALRDHFDHFLESCVLGLRKPDPRIYQHALETLGVRAEEAVFLDDIGSNLKTARALGLTTIKVGEPEPALDALGQLLGFPLRDG